LRGKIWPWLKRGLCGLLFYWTFKATLLCGADAEKNQRVKNFAETELKKKEKKKSYLISKSNENH
jgi:hypothetical protein